MVLWLCNRNPSRMQPKSSYRTQDFYLSLCKLVIIAPILRAVAATVFTSSALLLMARVQKPFQRNISAVLGTGLHLGAEA